MHMEWLFTFIFKRKMKKVCFPLMVMVSLQYTNNFNSNICDSFSHVYKRTFQNRF